MDGRIIYNETYKVLICLQHQYAITKGSLERHFRDDHGDCPLVTRRQILDEAGKLETVQPDEIIYSSFPVEPIQKLKLHTAYRCSDEECGEIKGTVGSITVHCRVKHLWTTKKGTGWTEVPVQTFFHGNHKRYYHMVLTLTVVISKSPKGIC
jgi:hypothetical protein